MDIIIHSLYKTKDVFLRELISNAADALDKIRFQSLTDPSALDATAELAVRIKADKDAKTITITDTGIGMTKSGLKTNLGTVAKSGTDGFSHNRYGASITKGTAAFLKEIEGKNLTDPGLIGKFGVGFYSAFLVSDKVQVVSKNNEDEQYVWESTSQSNYRIVKDPRGNTLKRGTEITLFLKEDAYSFLDRTGLDLTAVANNLESIAKKHSEYINFPIFVWSEKVVAETVSPEPADSDVEDVADADEEKQPETINRTVREWKRVNDVKPIWTRPSSEVTEDEYNNFFKAHFKDTADPLAYSHFKLEGDHRFTALLYVPATPPPKFLQPDSPLARNLQLFVRRVYITDELSDLLPKWLAFIKVLIDSDDLPLNVSRETLQNNAALKIIRNRIVSKALDLLLDLSEKQPEVYKKIHDTYGKALRYGLVDAKPKHQEVIKKLLRFVSSASDDTSLAEYVSNMKDKQPQIYFATGLSVDQTKQSPLAEKVIKRGYEVLLIADPLEEYVLTEKVKVFDDVPLQNVAKDGLKFGDEDESSEKEEKELQEKFEPLLDWLKESLADVVETVKVSFRLATAPCVVVPGGMGLTPSQEKAMVFQAQGRAEPMLKFYLDQKRIMEINPRHPLMRELLKAVEAGKTEAFAAVPAALYEVYSIASGYDAGSPTVFAERIEKVLRAVVGVPQDAAAEEKIKPAPKGPRKAKETVADDADHDEL
ncbi:hypothetical protein HDV03_005330 [Kappamyces sp. JEL0829]|nr:hypothetical protein HDV03_005330 [Kappamyces sp. JEL0829]